MTDAAEKYFNKLYPNGEFKLASTDPEFGEYSAVAEPPNLLE